MPGERLAKLTMRVTSLDTRLQLLNFPITSEAVVELRFLLGGTWVSFFPGRPYTANGTWYEFPNYVGTSPANPERELQRGVQALLLALRAAIAHLGLAYVVSAERPVPGGFDLATGLELGNGYEFDLEAAVYDRSYDLDFNVVVESAQLFVPYVGTRAMAYATTIRPVIVGVAWTDALIFDSPTGSITLTASNGNDGVYTYLWGDPPTGSVPTRTNVPNGTYSCIVSDTSGAYATVQVLVGSDPRLDVLISRVDHDVTVVATGGLPGYTYAWAHGPTTAQLLGLGVGTYTCTVTDTRGATRVVAVTIDPYRFYWSLNPVLLRLDAGADYRADPTSKPNLSFVCQVWVEAEYRSGTYVQVGGQLEQPADRAGRTVFDVQALLDSFLREYLPAVNQAAITRVDSQFRRFYLQYGERYGTPPVVGPLTTQEENYVVLGGLDFYEHAAGTWFDSYQAAARPFLTWEPNDKKCLPEQPEYLFFMPDAFALTEFRQWVRLRFDDHSSQVVLKGTVTNVHRFEVYCLPAGYQQLGLAPSTDVGAAGQAVCVAWETWVSGANNVPVTEVRRYRLDPTYYPNPRFFLYTNSLGGVTTLPALGDAKRTFDVDAEEADRPLGPDYDPQLGTAVQLRKTAQPILAIATPRTAAQRIADQELLLSPRVTLQRAGQYWPGTVKAKTTTIVDESAGVANLEFEFALVKQPRFSPRLPVTAVGRASAPVAGGEGAQP